MILVPLSPPRPYTFPWSCRGRSVRGDRHSMYRLRSLLATQSRADGPSLVAPHAVALALAASLVAPIVETARAQQTDANFWTADGPVYAAVRDGNTLYIGGNFSY